MSHQTTQSSVGEPLSASRDTPPPVGLLLSGGLDSCVLLAHLLEAGHAVQPFFVRSGLFWEEEELLAIERFSAALKAPQLRTLVTFELPLADVYGDHWSVHGRGAPDGFTEDDAVYLPGRNALLLLKTAIWCRLHGIESIVLAVLASNPFPDATPEFFTHLAGVITEATGGRLQIQRPFGHLHKHEVMQLGRHLPLHLSFSCIAPESGLHCGRCNKCMERRQAFSMINLPDLTAYSHRA